MRFWCFSTFTESRVGTNQLIISEYSISKIDVERNMSGANSRTLLVPWKIVNKFCAINKLGVSSE